MIFAEEIVVLPKLSVNFRARLKAMKLHALMLGFLPSRLGGLDCDFRTLGLSHGLEAALAANPSALPAHFGHNPRNLRAWGFGRRQYFYFWFCG
jgi:hypothetical protein